MPAYKTPDVYVEEISLFPPSVAQVETAVPAFIGYTQIADEFGKNDLRNVPKKITSIPEYIQFFGGAPPVDIENVELDENNIVSTFKVKSTYYLYDSIRLFFKNGGGKCYIISVGSYTEKIIKDNFETGLAALKKKDEPTIILFPDAVLLENNGLYDIQKSALQQCTDLQDRVAVLDLLEPKNNDNTTNWSKGIQDFRDSIGINNLKYGAAYTPWLKTSLGLNVQYRHIKGKLTRSQVKVLLENLTSDVDVKTKIKELNNTVEDVDLIRNNLKSLYDSNVFPSFKSKYLALVDELKNTTAAPNAKSAARAMLKFIFDMVDKIDEWGGGNAKNSSLIADIENAVSSSLKAPMIKLIAYNKGLESKFGGAFKNDANDKLLYEDYNPTKMGINHWGGIFEKGHADEPAQEIPVMSGTTDHDKLKTAEPQITAIFKQIESVLNDLIQFAAHYESIQEGNVLDVFPVLKHVLNKIATGLTTMPPSGAIAGVYAKVDATRGVWKAPANVSLNNVSDVTEIIDFADQEGLNVDPESGKSINAIRPFTGKGILVWGARTLMGNDNEWRYISVRRFFNMVEESVKKATYPFVFEPNDANTWIKIKSMIENYLIGLWRDGALFGSKPEHAFFVNVGLGTTMTAQDINEGRMIVEIGMAAVRPAEFIILRFSHKMAEV
ncbi:MAG: phage tail sheath subtilisin-like domain-containing protein [Deferribacteres bacterium]|nr:phage tail sheath subtilisin-like domain-containing protein [Deferribacteres bacterium]